MDKTSLNNKSHDRFTLLLIAVSSVLLTSFVCPYAPWFRYCFETDETVYRILSLGWIRGKLPYRDLFDHKGPLSYVFYALGLLLSGGKNWGMWIIFCIVNAVTFTTMYRIFRLKFNENISLLSSASLIFLLTFFKDSLFGSSSRPENIITMFLMLSSYTFVKALLRFSELEPDDRRSRSSFVFTKSEMLLIGLYCGCVFLIKFNVCVFYLTFIGSYFIWLMVKARWREFFSRVGLFLSGLISVTALFCIYYYVRGGLSDMLNTYFLFNIRSGLSGKWRLHIFQPRIPFTTQAVTLFLILCSAAVIYITLKSASGKKLQFIVYFICGAVCYFFITLPEIYYYSFIVLLPLYMVGIPFLIDLLTTRRTLRLSKAKICTLFVIPVLLSFLVNFIAIPSVPRQPTEFETKMEEFSRSHPKATYIFFMSNTFASPMFYDLTSEVPDFRYFYIPLRATAKMENEHLKSIAKGQPDVIVIQNAKDQNPEVMQTFYDFFEKYGYEYYLEGDGYKYGSNYLIYTKKNP